MLLLPHIVNIKKGNSRYVCMMYVAVQTTYTYMSEVKYIFVSMFQAMVSIKHKLKIIEVR